MTCLNDPVAARTDALTARCCAEYAGGRWRDIQRAGVEIDDAVSELCLHFLPRARRRTEDDEIKRLISGNARGVLNRYLQCQNPFPTRIGTTSGMTTSGERKTGCPATKSVSGSNRMTTGMNQLFRGRGLVGPRIRSPRPTRDSTFRPISRASLTASRTLSVQGSASAGLNRLAAKSPTASG